MKLGLIGHPLSHSWSSEIHQHLIGAEYALWDIEYNDLASFLQERTFDGINVTIPYKQEVISHLDAIDEHAKRIGAVNCIVLKEQRLIGHNTDYDGFKNMLEANHIALKDKNVVILGNGGASKAVQEALNDLDVSYEIANRHTDNGVMDYEALYKKASSIQVIIQTTPVGMYPTIDAIPIDLEPFTNLETVIDIIANPLRTKLLQNAAEKGCKTYNGFEMLVRQAAVADEYFIEEKVREEKIQDCIQTLLSEKRNIVLIGMPTSGKTTIGKVLAQELGKDFIDMDQEIEKRIGMPIRDYFKENGEDAFRDQEENLAKELIHPLGQVISCGGGIIKRAINIEYLRANGILIWLDRDIEHLFGSKDRPLSQTKEDIEKLNEERKPYYERYCDIHIDNNGTIEETINVIKKHLGRK